MHPCLRVDEIIRFLANELVELEAKRTAVALARCCKTFEEPVLDVLWEVQDQLTPLLMCLPEDTWEVHRGAYGGFKFAFKRTPTKAEWAGIQKHALRMRNLELKSYQDPEILDLLLVQSHITNDPWLPRLKGFRWDRVTEELIPLIPFFLSPRTTKINITMVFGKCVPAALIVPIITRLPTLCPDMDDICLGTLPNDPVITEVVSEMLLACKKDQLRTFRVDSPLTKEALEVVCQLPKLSHLKVVVEGSAPLPRLPNLATISIAFDSCLDWLEGFRGARLARLESVDFFSASGVVDDFFGVFERATLTTVKHSLSKLSFCTVYRWKPNYRPLVPFTQLEELSVEFSCIGICSSGIDDDVIVELAEAMPKLKVLILGDPPCDVITGVTIKGLTALAHNCQHLSRLRIHFRVDSVVEAVEIQRQSRSLRETTAWKHDCALTDLEVGMTPILGLGGWRIAKGLLQIFPCLRKIRFFGMPPWREVQQVLLSSAETIESNHQTGMHPIGEASGPRVN